MNTQKKRAGRNRIARTLTVCMLVLSLAAGTAAFAEPAFGAAEFAGTTPFSNTGRTTYYHNGRYTGNVVANGVDMSDWQSAQSNLAAAKASGVDFAILRVTWTSYSKSKYSYRNLDSSFAANYRNARAAGVMTGAYVFSQARNAEEARNEATFAVERLRALGITGSVMELPVYMDYEFAGSKTTGRLYGINRTTATQAAIAFCEVIRNAGFTPGIYANTSFFSSYINTALLPGDIDLWCAQYYSRCQSGVNYSKWQYSSSAHINGLLSYTGRTGNIDVNFWYLNPSSNLSPAVTVSSVANGSYTGGAVKPQVTLTNGGTQLRENVDYVIGGINNVNNGTAYAYIKGIGKYSGQMVVPYSIGGENTLNVTTKIKSLKARKKGFYVKVKKKKKGTVSGYQVRYSRRADMEESVVKTIGKKYNKVSKKITCNARHMKYYVQVRTYKKTANGKIYSKWSKIKTVKSK